MKVTLKKFELMLGGELPAELQTIYKWSSKEIVNWIDRLDPDGRRGRELWIDIQKYNQWADPRGHKVIEGRALS
jgi:hypothetical protein